MAQLLLLPPEILVNIIEWIPPSYLPALGSTCKIFHHLVIPRLYHSIYFNKFPHWTGSRQLPPHDEPSTISNLNSFLSSITESENLRSFVTIACFQWVFLNMAGTEPTENTISGILALLLPSLQSLRISALSLFKVIFGLNEFKFPSKVALTSLYLVFEEEVYFSLDFGVEWFSRNRMHCLFTLPSLRHLSIEGVADWHHVGSEPLESSKPKSRFSELKSLSCTATFPASNELTELLTWPKALEKFHYKICGGSTLLSPGKLIDALRPHRDSLHDLHVTGAPGEHGMDETTAEGIEDFPHLKRLSIPIDFLVMSGERSRLFNISLGKREIWEVLPQTLEVLKLEIPEGYEVGNERPCHSSRAYILGGVSEGPKDVMGMLREISHHTRTRYPNLRDVITFPAPRS